MGVQYTRAERELIGGAWSAVMHRADACGWSCRRRLEAAQKHERRERSCLTAARALLLESIFNLDGQGQLRSAEPTAADLYQYADGCAAAALVGAHWRETSPDWYAPLAERAAQAVRAHAASISRALAAV